MNIKEEDYDSLIWGDGIWTEDSVELIEVVDKEYEYVDLGKCYINWKITIHEIVTGKYYQAILMQNEYHKSKNVEWKEVFPYQQTITKYK